MLSPFTSVWEGELLENEKYNASHAYYLNLRGGGSTMTELNQGAKAAAKQMEEELKAKQQEAKEIEKREAERAAASSTETSDTVEDSASTHAEDAVDEMPELEVVDKTEQKPLGILCCPP